MCIAGPWSTSKTAMTTVTDSSLQKLRSCLTVDLHPSKGNDVKGGATEQLNKLLLRYNDDFDGVVLSYANERVSTQHARVHPYFPYIRVGISADLIIFKPQVGARLLGSVSKIGADYIGLLVFGFINVVLARSDIRSDMRPDLDENCWKSTKSPEHKMEVGTDVWFRVKSMSCCGDFMSLTGLLKEADTGAVGHVPSALDCGKGSKRKERSSHKISKGEKKTKRDK